MESLFSSETLFILFVSFGGGLFLARYIHFIFQDRPQQMQQQKDIWLRFGVPCAEQHWKDYLYALLWFNALGILATYLILRFQDFLPLNPMALAGVPDLTALHTAVSFATNTNYQIYNGEASLSYFSQSIALGVQNFLSAATGMAVAMAFIRSLARESSQTIGNFWHDMLRSAIYVLLPLSILFGGILAWQGVPQDYAAYGTAQVAEKDVRIPQGPMASQIAIKQLGSNGGGYVGMNSAHPLENPTGISNALQIIAILLVPCALVFAFGRMVGDSRQGYNLFICMFLLLTVSYAVIAHYESATPGWLQNMMQSEFPGHTLSNAQLGNMEGKEMRFTVNSTALWAAVTTATSSGSANLALDSMMPLSVFMAVLNMKLGEVVFGGVGSGLYALFLMVFLTVFLSGLMIGRTPEYLGKKIEVKEIKYTMLALLIAPILILVATGIVVTQPFAQDIILNKGPRGFTEILYGFTSAAMNNGSALGGLNAAHPAIAWLQIILMLLGRYLFIWPVLAICGAIALRKRAASSGGTLPTHGVLFGIMLIFVILVLGALTYFPVLTFGSITEYLTVH